MALKDHIKKNHDKAENHPFVKVLLSGEVSVPVYADYLLNQLVCYGHLEQRAKAYGLFDGIEGIERAELIQNDYIAFTYPGKIYPSSFEYVKYIDELPVALLWGHIYARHFGDLYGGQIIKKVVPGDGTMYQFENRQELIAKVREKLSDDLADEANKALQFSLRLFDELAQSHNLTDAHEKESI
jgi:heme oxygenase